MISALKIEKGDAVYRLPPLLPVKDVDVVMGPVRGEDAAVIRLGDGFLIVQSTHVTTGVKRAGYVAVHVAGNSIAVRGARPRWFLPVVFLPRHFGEADKVEFFKDMERALNEIGGTVVGGFAGTITEFTRPLIAVTAVGYTKTKVILTRDARPGDLVYVVGKIAGEGVGIIAWDFEKKLLEEGVSEDIVNAAKKLIHEVSVVDIALKIIDYVNTMHSAVEGGILQALREVAIASRSAVIIDKDKIRLEEPVRVVTSQMRLDPLKLLSGGCIIVTVPPNSQKEFEKVAEDLGKSFSLIGYVVEGGGEVFVNSENGVEVIRDDLVDEIYKLWQ